MIKKILLTGIFLLSFGLKAQTILNSAITSSQTVEAPNWISLQPGFSVLSSPNLIFTARIVPTPTNPTTNPIDCSQYGKVVISEIHFDTHYNERIEDKYHYFGEYIELFNSSDTAIDLKGWVIKDNRTTFTLNQDEVNGDLIIPPGGHKIITYGGFKYYGAWNQHTPQVRAGGAESAIGGRAKFEELFPDVIAASGYNRPSSIVLQNTMVLYNESDRVSLHAPNGKLVDQVLYKQDNQGLYVGYDDGTLSLTGPYLTNDDGGVFNGPIGQVYLRDADGVIQYEADGITPQTEQRDEFKKAIYRSTIESYYSNSPTTFAIATASPGSNPQLTIPLKPLDPYMTSLTPSPNEDNATEVIAYDIKTGSIIGHNKTYFDDFGKPKVSLAKDFETQITWGTEKVYDDFGRVWKESFPVPTCLDFDNINYLSNATYKSQFLDTFYSDNNTLEAYQATAEQPYSEVKYDQLNPGNTISVIAGNKIDGDWRNGFSYAMAAAQEMYYAFGSGYFYYNTDINNYYIPIYGNKTYPDYDLLGLTAYKVKTVNSNNDLSVYPYTENISGAIYFDLKANSPLEIGKIYKVLMSGSPVYVQILEQPGAFRNTQNIWASMKILEGSWNNFSEISEYYAMNGLEQEIQTVLSDNTKIIAGLKCIKNITIDPNGIENVSFTDSDGKPLAVARSGGSMQYPVTSLIGLQGFVDIHLPKGCGGTLSYIGGASLYNVYDLKTGNLLTDLEKANLAPGVYRIGLKNTANLTTLANLAYIVKSTGAILPVAANSRGVNYNVNYYDYSVNIYTKTGQLIKKVQPRGYESNTVIKAMPAHMLPTATAFISTFTYNDQGQIKETQSPDEGKSKFVYRNDGKIRYSQSALQADTKVSYTNYDEYARPVESGVLTAAAGIWTQASANPDTALITGAKSEQTFSIYDYNGNYDNTGIAPGDQIPANLQLSTLMGAGYIQENLAGNVAVTYSKAVSVINAITWYNYDAYGRIVWVVQYNEGLGAKTLHYEYDYKGNVSKVIYQKDNITELFAHRYTYNLKNVLTKVETSTDNSTFITHADYDYYISGELKRTNIAQGAQGLDYVYTLGGQLKSINHPSLDPTKDPGHDLNDVFGITLDYYNGDYQRANTNITNSPSVGVNPDYNGNIKATRWANKNDIAGGVTNQKAYVYNYNRNNYLAEATFGSTNNAGVITPASLFKEGALTYDANGNIKTLQRTNETGQVTDNLTYAYNSNNQLNNVNDAVAAGAVNYDIDSQSANNYQYNAIGQLIKNNGEGLDYFYNAQGLTTEVKKNGNTVVKFFYNERGQRIKKESYTTAGIYQYTDYYALDISGNTLAIYNKPAAGSITERELPIYGLSRLGVYVKNPVPTNPDYINYQIADHLGNVRAVLKKIVGNPIVAMYTFADYYPFGEKLPSRDNITGNYRYAYQGQEHDGETGMEAFQLRLWDGRIGRWLNPDPYGQHASPYSGMGNNPVSHIDPDGGYETWLGAFFGWVGSGFQGSIGHNDNASNANNNYYVDNSFVDSNGMANIVHSYGKKDNWGYYTAKNELGSPVYIIPGNWGGITLPTFNGGAIFASSEKRGLIQHERGHIEQIRELGGLDYLKDVGFPSIYNTAENWLEGELYGKTLFSVDHEEFYTETDANIKAFWLYGGKFNHRERSPGVEPYNPLIGKISELSTFQRLKAYMRHEEYHQYVKYRKEINASNTFQY